MTSIALYRALIEANVSESLASEAVKESSQQAVDDKMANLTQAMAIARNEIRQIKWTQGFVIAGIIAILAKLFFV